MTLLTSCDQTYKICCGFFFSGTRYGQSHSALYGQAPDAHEIAPHTLHKTTGREADVVERERLAGRGVLSPPVLHLVQGHERNMLERWHSHLH